MAKMYTIDQRSWRQKVDDFRYEVSYKLQQCADYMRENKDVLMIVVPIAAGGVSTIVRTIVKHSHLRKEEMLKERYIYDRSLGAYWKLKRKLKKSEQLEIARRRETGRSLGNILNDLNLI